MHDKTPPIGLIAGSGLQTLDELTAVREVSIETPFGRPSAPLILGRFGDTPVAFVRRHGVGHAIPPTNINVRANIFALKTLGVRQVISLSAVGSLIERAPPGTFALITQFVDRTYARDKTFFGPGLVGHVAFGDPTCACMVKTLQSCTRRAGIPTLEQATYVVMEGPQFSTKAEAAFHRMLGGQIIGMTAMPEAKLCREAEMCYAMIAMVTDFDCWREDCAAVTADAVSKVMDKNSRLAAVLLSAVLPRLSKVKAPCPRGCDRALDGAIMTSPEALDRAMVETLRPIVGRVLGLMQHAAYIETGTCTAS